MTHSDLSATQNAKKKIIIEARCKIIEFNYLRKKLKIVSFKIHMRLKIEGKN